jgi:chemotaxis response regulator CheB
MPKILLVEDNAINRDMLTRRLQRHGFSVCCAHDGAAGVAMAASEMPDLILMDVALGEMDGWPAIGTRASKSGVPISTRSRSICSGCWVKFEAVCLPPIAKAPSPEVPIGDGDRQIA